MGACQTNLSVERVYESLKEKVVELIATRSEWARDLP
jgi:hypothetical protein